MKLTMGYASPATVRLDPQTNPIGGTPLWLASRDAEIATLRAQRDELVAALEAVLGVYFQDVSAFNTIPTIVRTALSRATSSTVGGV